MLPSSWQGAAQGKARRREKRDPFEDIAMFCGGKDTVNVTMGALIRRLEKAGIPYTVVSSMAVYADGSERTTKEDVLMTREGFAASMSPIWKNSIPSCTAASANAWKCAARMNELHERANVSSPSGQPFF